MLQGSSLYIYSIGDQGITLELGDQLNEASNRKIMQLFDALQQRQIKGVLDIIPAYQSISLIYDLVKIKKLAGAETGFHFLERQLKEIWAGLPDSIPFEAGRQIRIPVCYDTSLAPDLLELAAMHQITVDELIRLHSSKPYHVYMVGFLPGFAYMGMVDDRIASPRKDSPRMQVPPGSVGIAGSQTGIYPFASPGGWQLIGQTPVRLFDASKEPPTYLQPGDTIYFDPIDLDEFDHLKNQMG